MTRPNQPLQQTGAASRYCGFRRLSKRPLLLNGASFGSLAEDHLASAKGMSVRIRPAVEGDAVGVGRVLFEAVRQTAAPFYPREVIENWSPAPDERRYAQIRDTIAGTDELCLVADDDGEVVGFGSIVPSSHELRAVYVRPDFGRSGVGASILHELERIAMARGLSELHMDASLNAESFYLRHGYEVVERGVHRMAGGGQMACVKMRKLLLEGRR